MDRQDSIFVAGHRGLAGAAIVRRLKAAGFENLNLRGREDLDLTRQACVDRFFADQRPRYVFIAAAKAGGILANQTYAADFIRENLLIETNIIDAAYRCGVRKILSISSACIYPKFAPQPMKEESLLTGPLEPANEPYAIAKIAAIKTVQAYRAQYGFDAISIVPCNLYGPGDNFDPRNSTVLPGLIRRFHEAKASEAGEVVVWGTGNARREFLHIDDFADAALFLMQHYSSGEIVNVGSGEDIAIRDLARLVASVTGFHGKITQDTSKPEGQARKVLDVSRLTRAGWRAQVGLREGIVETYRWYQGGGQIDRKR